MIGTGRPLRERAKAVIKDKGATLVATVGDELPRIPRAASVDDAIRMADAIALCTAIPDRAAIAGAALAAGRHVVLENPWDIDGPGLTDLAEAARRAHRVLHLAVPVLLEGSARTLTAQIADLAIQRTALRLEIPGPDGLPDQRVLPSLRDALHRWLAVTGPVAEIETSDAEPGRIAARLAFAHGAPGSLEILLGTGFAPRFTLEVVDPLGSWRQENGALYQGGVPQTLLEALPTRAEDHAFAVRQISEGARSYVTLGEALHVLRFGRLLLAGHTGRVPAT